MRTDILKAQMANQPFAIREKDLAMYEDALNNNAPHAEVLGNSASESVTLELLKHLAVIEVDGAMWKKAISGECGESVAAYSTIIKYIDIAENMPEISTILFIVDTPGGSVAGVEEVSDRIFNSKKRTITLYRNLGASAGVWAFSASKEIYATKTTQIGSIGVIVTYLEEDENLKNNSGVKRITHVSKNAENKTCTLGKDCEDKIKTTIDKYEEMFFEAITRNTGFTSEQIISTFHNGDLIFAEEAKQAGFIKDIISSQDLIEQLLNKSQIQVGGINAAIPEKKLASNITKGVPMTEEEMVSMKIENGILTGVNKTLSTDLAEAKAIAEAAAQELSAMKESFDAKISDSAEMAITEAVRVANEKAADAATAKLDLYKTRVLEAFTTGVATATTINAMLSADSDEVSSQIAIAAKSNTQAIGNHASTKSDMLAYAESKRGSIK